MSIQEPTQNAIDRYIKIFGMPTTSKHLAHMVGYFGEGYVTQLSNFIYREMDDGEAVSLIRGMMPGCRCMCCEGWHLVDAAGETLHYTESLVDWAVDAPSATAAAGDGGAQS